MLKRVTVTNFKGFKGSVTFDLSNTRDFVFNKQLVKNGIVNKGLIYGINGSGKSNIGFAIFDIVKTLSDKTVSPSQLTGAYNNLDNSDPMSEFEYEFQFGDDDAVYSYRKYGPNIIVNEKLTLNGKVVIDVSLSDTVYDFKVFDTNELPDLKNLSLNAGGNNYSALKYISRSNHCSNDNVIMKIASFADNMLWFRSLNNNEYTGFSIGAEDIHDAIVRNGKLKELEEFLSRNEIHYRLESRMINGMNMIFAKFKHGIADFGAISSNGTRALTLLFYWIMKSSDRLSFLFIDEFDAYYHYESAEFVFKYLSEFENFQTIMTTHNTYLMRNSISRPDTVFVMSDNKEIKQLSELTDRELREAHNIEKMYRNGAFEE